MFLLRQCENNLIESVRLLFLQNNVTHLNWEVLLPDSTLETQILIVNNTVNLDLVLKFPISVNYQKLFLKSLIDYLDKQETEIADILYSEYGRLVALPSSAENFKHYYISSIGVDIILKENENLLTQGTTGLKTWQASLALAGWSLENKTNLKGTTILELGAGIGLTGLAVTLFCTPRKYIFSDCHPAVLSKLCSNIKLNSSCENFDSVSYNDNIGYSENNDNLNVNCLLETSINSSEVSVSNLFWQDLTQETAKRLGKIDFIFAADVVYDPDLFPHLINCILNVFLHCKTREAIISCTERSSETLDDFLKQLDDNNLKIQELKVPEQNYFSRPNLTPVRIFSIRF